MFAKYEQALKDIQETNGKLKKAGFKTEFVYMTVDMFGQVRSKLEEDRNGCHYFDNLEVLKVRNDQSVSAEWTIAVAKKS